MEQDIPGYLIKYHFITVYSGTYLSERYGNKVHWHPLCLPPGISTFLAGFCSLCRTDAKLGSDAEKGLADTGVATIELPGVFLTKIFIMWRRY